MSLYSTELPASLYTAEQTRALDRTAIAAGIPGFRLMQRAGHAAFDRLQQRWPGVKRITILCGSGNNGGDGFVIAVLAAQQGIDVQLLCLGNSGFADKLLGEALEAYQWMREQGVTEQYYKPGVGFTGELVVDALLGTGLSGAVRGPVVSAIEQINSCSKPVLAIDIPSGLCSDSGVILGCAVKADLTITFIGLKQGLFTHQGVDCCGEVVFDSLRVPDEVYESVPVSGFRTCEDDLQALLPPRTASSHKGSFGHVMVIGGDRGMGGAAIMAAQAAGRAGAGLVSVATRAEHIPALLTRCPEAMGHSVVSGLELEPLMARADVLVVGPGLGQGAWGEQLLQQALSSKKPLVLDADALNLLHSRGVFGSISGNNFSGNKWVITPHPGEAARLLNMETAAVQADRFFAVERLQALFGGTAVLKGPGTLSCDGDAMHLCSAGNPGMASGGMGDLLSGIVGALLAQGLAYPDAARLGVYIHATAGDRCAQEHGERGMQATDLLAQLRSVVNGK
ncbi:MAG: NAD(P)H-hydrate dehydratase [Amphritea sp.]